MRPIHGITFGYCAPRGFTRREEWRTSLRLMQEETGCDTMVLAVAALQDHTYSTRVDYETPDVMSMDDVRAVCAEAKRLGLRIILKAMVNCRDGYWRAYIRFFDHEEPCEPTWRQWFDSYTTFVSALAETAGECGAEMLCVGCEMVGTDHRAEDWRRLITEARQRYDGLITYNCDKYQEEHITWWDAVDVMSASGYYPIGEIGENLDRISRVIARENKPYLFMECGCPSREGSEQLPNDWRYAGAQSNAAQARWCSAFSEALRTQPLIQGMVWWDWSARLYPPEHAAVDEGYGIFRKPACQVLRQFYETWP